MKKVLLIIIGAFILIQLVPYGREHSNPEIVTQPPWDSPQTKELFDTACKDCHSNYTEWPWYSNIAPASWLIQSDVYEGREHFNISAKPVSAHKAKEAVEEVEKDKMPLAVYLPLHPEADFTPEQKAAFLNGLKNTFKIAGGSQNDEINNESGENEDEEENEHESH